MIELERLAKIERSIQLVLCIPAANCAKRYFPDIIEHLFWTTKERKRHCVARMNFLVSRG